MVITQDERHEVGLYFNGNYLKRFMTACCVVPAISLNPFTEKSYLCCSWYSWCLQDPFLLK